MKDVKTTKQALKEARKIGREAARNHEILKRCEPRIITNISRVETQYEVSIECAVIYFKEILRSFISLFRRKRP